MEYHVGDRVICTCCLGADEPTVGEMGTVVDVPDAIRWDEYRPHRHNCGGRCEEGHGWYMLPEHFTLYVEDEVDYLDPIDDIV